MSTNGLLKPNAKTSYPKFCYGTPLNRRLFGLSKKEETKIKQARQSESQENINDR